MEGHSEKVGGGATEKRVAALEKVVECEASIDGARPSSGRGASSRRAALDDAGSAGRFR